MDLRTAFLSYCKAGRRIEDNEVAEVERLAELVKDHLRQQALAGVAQQAESPVLYVYSADGTSELVTYQQSVKGPSGRKSLLRQGRMLVELLMQRVWVKSWTAPDVLEMAMLVKDPVPLLVGKESMGTSSQLPVTSSPC